MFTLFRGVNVFLYFTMVGDCDYFYFNAKYEMNFHAYEYSYFYAFSVTKFLGISIL